MNWDDIRIFLALDRERTFKGAARELGVHGSTVSRRLDAFEEALGSQLFSRTPDGLVPTGAADRIRATATEVETASHALERALHGWESVPVGVVRVALLDSLATHLVAERVGDLVRQHPGIVLELAPGVALVDLTRGEADLAIRLVRPIRGDLVYKQVASTTMRVYAHERLAEALDGPVDPSELAWVGWDTESSQGPDARWLTAFVPDERIVFRSQNLDVLVKAVAGGAGAGLIPAELAFAYPDIVPVDVTAPLPPPMPLWLVTHRALRRVPRIDAVWTWLETILGELDLEAQRQADSGYSP